MADLLPVVAEAMRNEVGRGRSYAEVGAELKIPQRTVAAIVLGERQVGPKTFRSVMAAKPPWLLRKVPAALWDEETEAGDRGIDEGPAGAGRWGGGNGGAPAERGWSDDDILM